MPLPGVAIWITVALATALTGTTIGMLWDNILIKFRGKRLAVLGARGVGKTHLLKFLTTGSIPAEYKQTVAPEKTSSNHFRLKDLDLKVKDSFDLSGDKAAYGEWKKCHDEADVVFYLLRADLLIAGDRDVEVRVRDDLKHIGGWLDARTPRPTFFIIGTHCDLDPEFSSTPEGDYSDKFRRLPIIVELVSRAGGGQQAKVVLGSMKTRQGSEALVYQILMQVAQ